MVAKRKEALEHLRTMRAGFAGGTKRIPTRLPVYQEEDVELSSRSEINTEKIIPLKKVGRKDIPVCSKEIALLNNAKPQWLTKQTWTFKPEEMHDLEFVPAMPVFTAALAHTEGALAAANLKQLGTSGVAALISAMQNKNPAVRAHATSAAENMFAISFPNRNAKDDEYSGQRELNPELLKLLPTLLSDPDPEVRLHAVTAAWNSGSPAFFNRMFELLRDDYVEISEAARDYLKNQRAELPKHIPAFRQMLRDTNVNVQIAGLRLLMSIPDVKIPREDLVALFSAPRMELAGAAVGYLRKDVSCEEAKLLLLNSHWMVRRIGLAILMKNKNSQSVELAIPLLRDPDEDVQTRAHDLLTDLTGQNFPAQQPEQWEKWWEQNKASFAVTISPEELRNKQIERIRQRRRMETDPTP